jgi:hypothetical protein
MKKAGRLAALFLVLSGVAGCGESPQVLTHDLVVFWNEVCDNMVRATSEEKAGELLKVQFKLLGKKQETLKERFEKRLKDLKKDDAKELDEALLDYYDEIVATEKRLKNCQSYLQKIIDATPSHAELVKVRDWPNSKKVFNQVPLLDFEPRKGDPNCPKDDHFFTGMVPKRPQFTFANKK